MQLHVLNEENIFPDIEQAIDDPDGLLAMGGDLSPSRLINAYRHGIFPWFSDDQPILWWSPQTRAILKPEAIHISHSMKKWLKKTTYQTTVNHDFSSVIHYCAHRPNEGTWITAGMQQAYINLHRLGVAHSIEIWDENALIGGLYGVCIGQIFCGESMFHCATNASKLAFIRLAEHFGKNGGQWIDAQMPTAHLTSMGVTPCSRQHFRSLIEQHRDHPLNKECWIPQTL
ncbi:MAG: Leucyl/phenylalanyl-tRNA--protein transferase [Candidatus Celerinatantimonas neptuna]|nr:MAG: Leucyl/phenylalanyl-tRNA--protein transferase [Candidatus Celerinatantimonas neptuna]